MVWQSCALAMGNTVLLIAGQPTLLLVKQRGFWHCIESFSYSLQEEKCIAVEDLLFNRSCSHSNHLHAFSCYALIFTASNYREMKEGYQHTLNICHQKTNM